MSKPYGNCRPWSRSLASLFLLGCLLDVATGLAQEWEYLGLPPNSSTTITDIAALNANTVFASTYDYGFTGPGNIFRTTNAGATWDTVVTSAGTLCLRIHPWDENVVFSCLGSLGGPWGILKTTDGGDHWFHADSGIYLDSYAWVRVIEFDPVHPETLYAGTAGLGEGSLYKTTNSGSNWTEIHSGLADGISFIAIDPLSTETIYVCDATGYGLSKSTNGGTNWEGTSLSGGGYALNGLALDPVDPNIVYVGLGGGLGFFRSTDAGDTWEHMTSGLPQAGIADIVVNQFTREVFTFPFPYYEEYIFRSADIGVTWDSIGGLPSGGRPSTIAISSDQTRLFVARPDLGIYSTTIFVTDVSRAHDHLPTAIELAHNYPNPFNPSTTIRFSLPRSADVTLKIYNTLGQLVKTLVDGYVQAGYKEIVWNGRNDSGASIASGIYIYRMTAGTFTATKRMILIK